MDYAPNVRFCEVLLNGAYQGVYVMMENITAGGDGGGRLNLTVDAKRNTFSGYLLRLDLEVIGEEDTLADINHFTSYARRTQQELEIVYPGASNLTEEISHPVWIFQKERDRVCGGDERGIFQETAGKGFGEQKDGSGAEGPDGGAEAGE